MRLSRFFRFLFSAPSRLFANRPTCGDLRIRDEVDWLAVSSAKMSDGPSRVFSSTAVDFPLSGDFRPPASTNAERASFSSGAVARGVHPGFADVADMATHRTAMICAGSRSVIGAPCAVCSVNLSAEPRPRQLHVYVFAATGRCGDSHRVPAPYHQDPVVPTEITS